MPTVTRKHKIKKKPFTLQVFIPTRGRINNQLTLRTHFFDQIVQQVDWVDLKIVCPKSEQEEFRQTHPWCKSHILTVPDTFRFGSVLQFIADLPGRYKYICDDDFYLWRRRDPLSVSQVGGRATLEDVVDVLNRIRSWLQKGYAYGGISLRQTNRYAPGIVSLTNTRICGNEFFDSRVLQQEGIRFDVVQARSDFHVTLSLLELGYCTICDYEFMVGQPSGGSNAPGGCASYRTSKFLLQQAKLLAKLHPTAIKLVYKRHVSENLKALEDEQGMPDVRVSWLKTLGVRSQDRRYKGDAYVLCD